MIEESQENDKFLDTRVSVTDAQRASESEANEQTVSAAQHDALMEAVKKISPRLEIKKKIGQGGMCAVYLARHLIMNKDVAIKILLPHLFTNPVMLRRFQQETQATAVLNHPNIIRIHDTDISRNELAYIVMDYIDGESLHDLLEHEWRLKPEVAIDLFVQLAQGLAHAHQHGIIHRDLKPSNVMLLSATDDHAVQVKLVDFGIAKLMHQDELGQSLTRTGDVFGSPLYMSPEQCSGDKLDSRSDIYSLGCLMYETLSGQAPIMGTNAMETMQMHMLKPPEEFVLESSPDVLKKDLQTIIMKCLAKRPEDRYQTADAVLQDLLAASKGEFGVAKQQLVNRQLHKKIVFTILVALLFAAALFGVFVLGKMFQDKMAKPSTFTNVRLWNTPALKFPEATKKFDSQMDGTLINSIRMEGRQDMAAAPYFKAIWTEAVYLFECGEYSQAQKAFDNYENIQQGSFPKARASTMRGLCLFKLGKFDVAYISFANAKDQMAHAMQPFQQSIHLELQKTEASKFFLAYQAFLDDGVQPNLQEARDDYNALANLTLPKSDLVAAEERLADAYRRLGDWPNAGRVYSMAKGDLGEGDATASDRWKIALGQALVLRNMEGKSAEVQNILTEALALNPPGIIKTDQDKLVRSDMKHLLSKIQWEQGKTLEAVKSEFFDAVK